MQVKSNMDYLWIFISGFLLLSGYCNGYELFFQQAKMTLTVPIMDSSTQILNKNPLIKLKVADFTSTNDTSTYSIEVPTNFMEIDKSTGQLWFKQDIWMRTPINNTELVVSVSKADAVARMSIKLKFVKLIETKEFCENNLCFYDSIMFRMVESFNGTFKKEEIGDVAPKLYSRICKKYRVNYKLLNGTEYVTMKNNKMMSNSPINYENMKPGPKLNVALQCELQLGSFTRVSTKIFNITIIDQNDNLIKVQDNHVYTNLTLDSPYFTQGNTVNPHSFIVFTDDDTAIVNSNINFQLLNDKANVFEEDCKRVESNHKLGEQSTVFYCNLKYKKTGHYTVSPYCVVIQAVELIRGKNTTEGSKVCVYSDLNLIHEAELLPKPSELKNSKNIPATFKSPPAAIIDIGYPDEVVVLQNATLFARVVEPKAQVNDSSVIFKLLKDPLNAFKITKQGGIVYLQNTSALSKALPASNYRIEVGWRNEVRKIKIYLKEATTDCPDTDVHTNISHCSHYQFKEDCESACGIGSKNGRCKWRPHSGQLVSNIYNTCTPDIETCSNRNCDSLEKLNFLICPQDCTKNVLGIPNNQAIGIGGASNSKVCYCAGDHNQCFCDLPRRVTTTEMPTTVITESNTLNNDESTIDNSMTTDTAISGLLAVAQSAGGKECGTGCLFLMLGCPLLLVTIIIGLILMRRNYVKKVKKRKLLEGSVAYGRGSNDTEIINFEMPFIMHDALQQKSFDFDDKWEFDRNRLVMDTVLGEGEFGKVLKAYASDLNDVNGLTTVACKTVKNGGNSVELLALLSECQLLQEVCHPNVIKMLGACTKGDPPLIIIEYCCYGSLRSYLRLSRKLEEIGDVSMDGVEQVTCNDVLSFAYQICKGMAYLAEIKLVHRDLAARNVLLAEGKICKISDFGLTRDVYEDDAYLKKSKDRVPVKWMAPESLADHVYTTKTDVWSFGIVGWELITLGATPYPGVSPQNLYHLLRSGYRMERPDNCSEEIYSQLQSCWTDDPLQRPSFKILSRKFERLLGLSAKYLEVDDSSVSNPVYLANIDETLNGSIETCDTIKMEDENKRLDLLWTPPKFKTDVSAVDNKKYLLKYDDMLQTLLARYDTPRTLIEAKNVEQKLKYENDLQTIMPIIRQSKHGYINTSQPDLLYLTENEREKFIRSRYDTPSLKLRHSRSYMEMNLLRQKIPSQHHDSFDDNNNEMPCGRRTTINANLDMNDLDKNLNKDKDISFTFSSLNNLNQRLTSTEA